MKGMKSMTKKEMRNYLIQMGLQGKTEHESLTMLMEVLGIDLKEIRGLIEETKKGKKTETN